LVDLSEEGNDDMSSRLREAVIRRDEEAVEQIISSLDEKDNWSLVTIIDELLPLMLMESNLRYGSFHTVKMNLFLRRLAIEGYFSKATQRALAGLIALETARRDWIGISAARIGYVERNISSLAERMIEQLDRGNVHNAFYYAVALIEEEPEVLMQTLLSLGASAIPRTLGHSLSCFFPVVEDVISVDHPQVDSALLTYIMYLARYDASKDVLKKEYGQAESPMDYGAFLRLCASGTGLVEVHHTITFYIATEWEHARFNKDEAVPYGLLLDWVGEKELDKNRERRAANFTYSGDLPDTYEAFARQFSFEKLDDSIPCVFRMLEERPKKVVDWLFRLYASHHNHGWDPHYYTSLYSALRLYTRDRIRDKVACLMALDQALHYFAGRTI
jgi:hypothetical protein